MSQKLIAGGPIFVVGSPRSGTSILTWCLGQHPNLLPVPESNWMSQFAIDTAVAHARGSCRGHYSQLYAMGLTRDRLLQDIGISINQSIIEHRSAYLRQRAETSTGKQPVTFQIERDLSDPKTRWVNGTPEYSLGICGLRKLFPTALFIHIIRDCDKVVASMLHFHRVGQKNLAETEVDGFQKWERYVRSVLTAEEAYGSTTILRLLYDDLIERPEKAIRAALDFVGERFHADCLEPLTNRINSSVVDARYSIPQELDDHPDVIRARELWLNLRHGSLIGAPQPEAAQAIERQFEQYVQYFLNLDAQYARAQSTLKRVQEEFSERTAWALNLDQEIKRKDKLILKLQDEVEERSAWGKSLDEAIAEKDALIRELQQICEERTKWAHRLQAGLDEKAIQIRALQREVGKLNEARKKAPK